MLNAWFLIIHKCHMRCLHEGSNSCGSHSSVWSFLFIKSIREPVALNLTSSHESWRWHSARGSTAHSWRHHAWGWHTRRHTPAWGAHVWGTHSRGRTSHRHSWWRTYRKQVKHTKINLLLNAKDLFSMLVVYIIK